MNDELKFRLAMRTLEFIERMAIARPTTDTEENKFTVIKQKAPPQGERYLDDEIDDHLGNIMNDLIKEDTEE